MTTTRDRQRDLDVDFDGAAWDERPAFGSVRGWPWWGAVLLALGVSLVGAIVDMKLEKSLSMVFDGAYFIACVAAVVLVRRRNLFGPMVQSPLVLAVVVPLTVLATSGLGSGGKSAKLLAIAEPLLKAFPLMAITAGAVVLVGVIRYLTQRRPVDAVDGEAEPGPREPRRRPADRDDRANRDRDRDKDSGRRGRPAEGGRGGSSGSGGRPVANRSTGAERRGERGAPRDRAADPARGRGAERGGEPGRGRPSSAAERNRGSAPRSGSDRGPAARRMPREDGGRRQPRRRDDY